MASIPGVRLDITGASGSQGLLSPKSGWRCYVFPRGGAASQDSTGTLITFDSSSVASRFTANNWIQAGLSTANIRLVAAVGGNSISVSGAALTVAENDRIYVIGNTEPTLSGGSATYNTPNTLIRQRDDDAADLFANSMVTSNADGLIQFFSAASTYDCIIQDGNRANQGSIIDLPVGAVEGISTSDWAFFGSTVTMHAALGVTGWATFGQSVTIHGDLGVTGTVNLIGPLVVATAIGVTGTAAFNSAVTMHGALGVTGSAVFNSTLLVGATATINGALGVTGAATFGSAVTFQGNLTGVSVTGDAKFGSTNTLLNIARISAHRGTTHTASDWALGAGWGSTASLGLQASGTFDTAGRLDITAGGAGIAANPIITLTFKDGAFTTAPFAVCTRDDNNAPDTGWWKAATSVTIAQFTFVGTPVLASSYGFHYFIIR